MGLLDDRRDDFLVQRLIADWKELCKLSPYVKPRIGAKTMESAKEFCQLAGRLGKTPRELLERAIARYSPEWCRDTFKSDHAPLAVILGKSNRKWLAHELAQAQIQRATGADLDKQARGIVNTLLGTTTPANARLIVEGGWPADRALRIQVMKFLTEGDGCERA